MKTIYLLGLACSVASAGCQVEDADLAEGAITAFTLTPAAMTSDRFSMHYTGTVTAGFTSKRPATLTVNVAGQPVVTQAIDLSTQLTQPIDVTIPLVAEGPNAVSAELTYQGATLAADSVVIVAITAPTITIPTFTQTYTPHVGLHATGKIAVGVPVGYTVDHVDTSIDAGPWFPAISDGAGGWDATLVDPDVGDVDVAVRAEVSIDGEHASLTAHATMPVAPIFDCTAHHDAADPAHPVGDPTDSMQPMTELLATGGGGGVSGENRVMVGYFGNPAHHVASFAISGTPTTLQTNQLVTVVGQTVATSPTEIQVVFNTGALRCDTGQTQCDLPYNLAASVDGVQLCATNGSPFYGKVHRAF